MKLFLDYLKLVFILIILIFAVLIFHKLNVQQQVIIQNQKTQAQRGIDYINCLVNINPKAPLKAQEQTCLNIVPKVIE